MQAVAPAVAWWLQNKCCFQMANCVAVEQWHAGHERVMASWHTDVAMHSRCAILSAAPAKVIP